jgi:uncharacterized membrane-anchored protein
VIVASTTFGTAMADFADRSLGATIGDFLDKPVRQGGLSISRPLASAAIATVMVTLIILLPQRPERHPGIEATK